MENDTASRYNRVNTRTERFWESEQIDRIISILPDESDLTIGIGQNGWKVDCQIEGKRIFNVEIWNLEQCLESIENLLRRWKGDKQHGRRDTGRNQAVGDSGI